MKEPQQCTAMVLYSSDQGDEEGSSAKNYQDAEANGPDPQRFVGLSNQGATCYMNSLLQTLYMTPEFRSALYAWKHEVDGEDASDCIPLQLQRLFGQLQTSDCSSVETRALTTSFGWTAQDSFQQHDVQELCRVLFDALEKTLQGTVNEKLVTDLYQGTLRDYVLCKECHSESSRVDTFLDISLVLKPFGSNKTMNSVTESLEYFLKPEVLDGDNQYLCQTCNRKVDAVKGLKLERLPYLLSLQLKRFDFDYTTFQRIKLNDEVRFPMVLDMNSYVDGDQGEEAGVGRSKFQRLLSLEKRKLQGLPGTVDEVKREEGDVSEEEEVERVSTFVQGVPACSERAERAVEEAEAIGGGGGGDVLPPALIDCGDNTDPETEDTDKEVGLMV
ncbi:unnamed protein product [Choristocarpus tenellus]